MKAVASLLLAKAVNELEVIDGGYQLRNPRHHATFSAGGLLFQGTRGGPAWHWHLEYVGTADRALADVELGPVAPLRSSALTLHYARGRVVSSTEIFERGLLVADVPLRPAPLGGSFYTRYGDVFAMACWVAVALLAAAVARRLRADRAGHQDLVSGGAGNE